MLCGMTGTRSFSASDRANGPTKSVPIAFRNRRVPEMIMTRSSKMYEYWLKVGAAATAGSRARSSAPCPFDSGGKALP